MATKTRPRADERPRGGAAPDTMRPAAGDAPAAATPSDTEAHRSLAARFLAATRISIGWVFLWAFLDKTFALGFATGSLEEGGVDYFGPAAWINGGSPTEGFLTFGTSGPFADVFQSFAGAAWADWLFMLGLLGIGVGLLLGIAMRLSAASGALLLVLMWLAALLPENNPFMDDHLVYALALGAIYFARADRTWGLGDTWRETVLVRRYPILA